MLGHDGYRPCERNPFRVGNVGRDAIIDHEDAQSLQKHLEVSGDGPTLPLPWRGEVSFRCVIKLYDERYGTCVESGSFVERSPFFKVGLWLKARPRTKNLWTPPRVVRRRDR